MNLLLLFQLVLLGGTLSLAFPGESDLVTSIPELAHQLSSRHYSGYLRLPNSINMHYWFFESQTGHPEKDPMVLWLNGGPGCSSMLGALTENGPITIHRNGSLSLNPYAWNQKANVLYLESPYGVGFSYRGDLNYTLQTDASTAQLNLDSLREFFKKFPQFADNPFYITGESYAGVYIPTLSVLAIENKFPKNFKGSAMGNPLLDSISNYVANQQFLQNRGILGPDSYNILVKHCCTNSTSTDLRNCTTKNTIEEIKACAGAIANVSNTLLSYNINMYNIYDQCYFAPNQSHPKMSQFQMDQFNPFAPYGLFDQNYLSEGEFYSPGPAVLNVPCYNGEHVVKYLNKPEVRHALHIDEKAWNFGMCREDIGYNRSVVAMAPYVKKMVDSGLKVMIYSGDSDAACSFLGAQWFAEDLGYKTTVDYHPWHYEGQVAGFAKVFDKQFTLLTVHGAGHMVPEDKPGPALQMYHDFIGVH